MIKMEGLRSFTIWEIGAGAIIFPLGLFIFPWFVALFLLAYPIWVSGGWQVCFFEIKDLLL